MILFAGASGQRTGLLSRLDDLVVFYRMQTFAVNTRRTYASQLKRYLDFCTETNVLPVPISQQDLACYVVFLAEKLQFSSVKQYLNVVRILHEEAGFGNPLKDSWFLSSLLTGVRRTIGDTCKPKLPITADILKKIFFLLDFTCAEDISFWASSLVAFFSFLRKSHLFPSKAEGSSRGILLREHVSFFGDHVELCITDAKTIQFRERVHIVPIPRIEQCPLCPAQALLMVYQLLPEAPPSCPLFSFPGAAGVRRCLTYSKFLTKLKGFLATLGFNPAGYSGHSFRRGGASLALNSCHVPVELIKLQGDWRSDCYQRYLEPSMDLKLKVGTGMAQKVKELF